MPDSLQCAVCAAKAELARPQTPPRCTYMSGHVGAHRFCAQGGTRGRGRACARTPATWRRLALAAACLSSSAGFQSAAVKLAAAARHCYTMERWRVRSRTCSEMRRSASWLIGIHRKLRAFAMTPTLPTPPARSLAVVKGASVRAPKSASARLRAAARATAAARTAALQEAEAEVRGDPGEEGGAEGGPDGGRLAAGGVLYRVQRGHHAAVADGHRDVEEADDEHEHHARHGAHLRGRCGERGCECRDATWRGAASQADGPRAHCRADAGDGIKVVHVAGPGVLRQVRDHTTKQATSAHLQAELLGPDVLHGAAQRGVPRRLRHLLCARSCWRL